MSETALEPLGIRRASADDAAAVGRLLDDFNTEFGEPTPGAGTLAKRMRELIAADDFVVLLAGEEPRGLVILRFRPSIWTSRLECYVAELYVAPRCRGRGLGRALLERAIEYARDAGADRMELATGEDDTAARRLYERLGFSNRGGRSGGPVNFFYERDL